MQFMPSEDPAVRFDDILKNIQRIRKHTSDMVRDEFLLDEKWGNFSQGEKGNQASLIEIRRHLD